MRRRWGNSWDGTLCNHGGDPDGGPDETDGWGHTSPVGFFAKGASTSGALDMAGNVWQWCEEPYDEKAYEPRSAADDRLPASRARRSLGQPGAVLRSTGRFALAPRGVDVVGFRVVLR
ncbi:SUMF1/EgtB/PvdO family nonheme iron enzyme [bacterium]|nr:SUMF1/EgtB/PvdO family nonheme iron enzyme [bacterium]